MSKIYGCVDLNKLTHIDFENGDGVWSVTREELLAWLEHKDAEDAAVLREKAAKWNKVKEIAEQRKSWCSQQCPIYSKRCPELCYKAALIVDAIEGAKEAGQAKEEGDAGN